MLSSLPTDLLRLVALHLPLSALPTYMSLSRAIHRSCDKFFWSCLFKKQYPEASQYHLTLDARSAYRLWNDLAPFWLLGWKELQESCAMVEKELVGKNVQMVFSARHASRTHAFSTGETRPFENSHYVFHWTTISDSIPICVHHYSDTWGFKLVSRHTVYLTIFSLDDTVFVSMAQLCEEQKPVLPNRPPATKLSRSLDPELFPTVPDLISLIATGPRPGYLPIPSVPLLMKTVHNNQHCFYVQAQTHLTVHCPKELIENRWPLTQECWEQLLPLDQLLRKRY